MMSNVISIKGAREAPKAAQSRMQTTILTPEMVNQWLIPPFQRPLRVNAKVREVAETIKQTEVIDGVITLGLIRGNPSIYLVDGQHRIEAFRMSALGEALADIREMTFDNMAEMATEFDQLNSALKKMRPDDNLRALEYSLPALQQIRKHCEFVGYDVVRRGGSGAMVGMSPLLRCWAASQFETPSSSNSGMSASLLARELDNRQVESLVAFLNIALAAWGRDPEYYQLWKNLNLAMCMWLWNKLVMDRDRSGSKRYSVLTAADFKKCLMSLSAENDYVQWLPGRNLNDRDRNPCYQRLKAIFTRRLMAENPTRTKVQFPQPAWSHSR